MKNLKVIIISIVQIISFCLPLNCDQELEIELWGSCYNIETTTELNYAYTYLGDIPSRIGQLINLNYIHISDCGLSGIIPSEIGICII